MYVCVCMYVCSMYVCSMYVCKLSDWISAILIIGSDITQNILECGKIYIELYKLNKKLTPMHSVGWIVIRQLIYP